MAKFFGILSRFIVFCIFSTTVYTLSSTEGGPCSTTNDHLDGETHKLITDCTDKFFCSGIVNGTCKPKQCRRDEFPFGYGHKEPVPPLCPRGTFCPDEGSGCVPWLSVGKPCQLNRDEQCIPPPGFRRNANYSLESSSGSICLNSTCLYANGTAGLPCKIENTTYTEYDSTMLKVVLNVVRDNCKDPDFYCDPGILICEHTVGIGLPCSFDRNCRSHHCKGGFCADPPDTSLKVAPWQYAVTALLIVAAMIAICAILTLLHQRHRLERSKEVRDYYNEQISLRQAIIALHSAAADGHTDEKAFKRSVDRVR
ncbi:hypothetical protein SERLA73DRAFT_107716 [Serpula lacrymans var. lacrymans S7.3]|uniref:Dickkopf N-terminal cysteine-rich domain-containing protein n=2 Tax=Serpula lacrymans var. lacrymans TaxID=341189 RepID=F8PXN1_SERL3|nr:uncharacterized protein SERLADRAFT_361392 [Serpula lacrymans var. lacrymans S7.9]EGN98644.1 hypothetical protein SERLA73DRAFT_107716 [Serpula lacrymans var. lacrymans S7.3]EGO24212.1 hypothetical protein SERLADRAFT_361392 [Serpula lacrymans var. lacrymans S7.9]